MLKSIQPIYFSTFIGLCTLLSTILLGYYINIRTESEQCYHFESPSSVSRFWGAVIIRRQSLIILYLTSFLLKFLRFLSHGQSAPSNGSYQGYSEGRQSEMPIRSEKRGFLKWFRVHINEKEQKLFVFQELLMSTVLANLYAKANSERFTIFWWESLEI